MTSSYGAAITHLRHCLAERSRAHVHVDGFRHAAVAVALVDRDGQPFVPLTVRAAHLKHHSGQVSLPGGACDDDDESDIATAARELEEELGIDRAVLRPLGLLDDCATPSGYVITPVVFELDAEPIYRENREEVAEVFEAPLSLFGDPSAAEDMGERSFRGVTYRLFAYPYGDHRIWGATARILRNLSYCLSLARQMALEEEH